MDTATATVALESISHDSTKRPDSMLTRKSTSGESDYLLEFLAEYGGPTRCTCLEYVLSGREYPCLKRRIAKLQGITYESASQMNKCTCGGAWRKPVGGDWDWLEESEEPQEPEDYYYYFYNCYPPAETSGNDDDNGGAGSDSDDDSGINTDSDPESHPAESAKPSYKSGEDPETGDGAIGTVEEHDSEVMYCEEHGGWAGNLKRLCGACKDVYGDPFLCTSDDCPYAATGHWR